MQFQAKERERVSVDEKKNYTGLVIWFLCFLLFTFACCMLPEEWILRGVMQVCSLGVTVLIWMIYVNEKIYWINGVSFEEAQQAARWQRKDFAMRHLKIFLWFSVPYFIFSMLSFALSWSEWIDFAVGCIGLIAAAIATIPIKLETKNGDSV